MTRALTLNDLSGRMILDIEHSAIGTGPRIRTGGDEYFHIIIPSPEWVHYSFSFLGEANRYLVGHTIRNVYMATTNPQVIPDVPNINGIPLWIVSWKMIIQIEGVHDLFPDRDFWRTRFRTRTTQSPVDTVYQMYPLNILQTDRDNMPISLTRKKRPTIFESAPLAAPTRIIYE